MKWFTFPGLIALSLLVGCRKPDSESIAMAKCRLLAAQQGRELNCQHCDRCYVDPTTSDVVLEETQAGTVVRTWNFQ